MIATSYRYIVQRAGVRSRHPIVEGTRIGAHDVVAMVKTGASVDEVVGSFPSGVYINQITALLRI